jgi:deoxycytidylate deaminase
MSATQREKVDNPKAANATEPTQAVPSAGEAAPIEGSHPPSQGGLLRKPFADSELVFGLVAAVGTDLEQVRIVLEDRLKVLGYTVTQIRITKDVIPVAVAHLPVSWGGEFERLTGMMDAGDEARLKSTDNSILALGAAALINAQRPKDQEGQPQHQPKRAYIISSLKHPEEVARLRDIYPLGFYLIGVHSDEKRRLDFLTKDKGIHQEKAAMLMKRDADEAVKHGQKVVNTFHLSDFFVRIEGQGDRLKQSVWRILSLLFGNPYVTPTFDEYAMFMAFAASLRSADLSRQVGAVVTVEEQVVATGANDCPKAGGGLYWPVPYKQPEEVTFKEDGRDYVVGRDSNQAEEEKIINDILSRAEKEGLDREKVATALKNCRIHDLTEFGRAVHAEMEALLACGRAQIRAKGGTVYTTTFPCHNCAKHIVAAGILRVVFIEPYQKSKAAEFHTDSIEVGFADSDEEKDDRPMVKFEPFVGVGPRRFFDLFSIRLGSGYSVDRKNRETGKVLDWKSDLIRLRLQMRPASYLDLELIASELFNEARERMKETQNG